MSVALPNRIRLHESSDAYQRPADAIDRISLAWWLPGEADPVFIRGPHGGPSTVIIRWPTNDAGELDTAALHAHEYRVLPWHLTDKEFAWVARAHPLWHLRRADIRVEPSRLQPTLRTYREWPHLRAEAAIADCVAQLTQR